MEGSEEDWPLARFAAYVTVFVGSATCYAWAGWPVLGDGVEWWRIWVFAVCAQHPPPCAPLVASPV